MIIYLKGKHGIRTAYTPEDVKHHQSEGYEIIDLRKESGSTRTGEPPEEVNDIPDESTGMTVRLLKQWLFDHKIDYPAKAKKPELEQLYEANRD